MICFDARKIVTRKYFLDFVKHEKLSFEKKKKEIFEKYGFEKKNDWNDDVLNYQSFRDEYRQAVLQVLKNTIGVYRCFLPQNALITVFGSLAKTTDRLFSDVDFTICYDDAKNIIYECAEEIIDYSVACILGFSIDHIHGNFQHYPSMPSLCSITELDNHYQLVFDEGVINYKCGPETIQENMMNIKNVRNYDALISNFKNKYKNKTNIESLYSFLILENTTEHDFLNDMALLERENNIMSGYNFKLEKTVIRDTVSISELKKVLKECIVEFYIFMSKFRRSIRLSDAYSMDIEMFWNNSDFCRLVGSEYVKRLRSAYLYFLFCWNRVEYSLKEENIPLSTRCYVELPITEFDDILKKKWAQCMDLRMLISAKNSMNEIIRMGLDKI